MSASASARLGSVGCMAFLLGWGVLPSELDSTPTSLVVKAVRINAGPYKLIPRTNLLNAPAPPIHLAPGGFTWHLLAQLRRSPGTCWGPHLVDSPGTCWAPPFTWHLLGFTCPLLA